MRIAVAGAAGRMGRRIVANILESDNFQLTGALEYAGSPDLGKDAGLLAGCAACNVAITSDIEAALANADAVIDFATGGVMECARVAAAKNVAMVIGTTAMTNEEKAELKELTNKGFRLVMSGNMSVGVNLLFKVTKEVAKILGEDYDIEIVEMHHNQKKDAPSGTAARLAEVVCEALNLSYEDDLRHGREGMVGKRTKNEIGMHSLRGGDVVGDHTVIFAGTGERVELTHKASSRDVFVKGALRAALFLEKASAGLYDMQDVLGLR